MRSRLAGLLVLLAPLATGCALAIGATSAQPRALTEEGRGLWTPIGGGWERLTGVEGATGTWPVGVLAGQKYMRLSGGLSDRGASGGLGAERHVDLTARLWRVGASVAFGQYDQWVDYTGAFRMAWSGTYVAPRVSFAPIEWASVYAGYGFLKGKDTTLGYVEDPGWGQTAFNRKETDAFGRWPAAKGTQLVAGADLTLWRWGRGKVGVRTEYQRTRSEPLAMPGTAAGARFQSKGLSGEVYFGSF